MFGVGRTTFVEEAFGKRISDPSKELLVVGVSRLWGMGSLDLTMPPCWFSKGV